MFTDDGQHIALGAAATFDDVFGTAFVQQDDGSFFAAVSRDVGTGNPNPVHKQFRDVQ